MKPSLLATITIAGGGIPGITKSIKVVLKTIIDMYLNLQTKRFKNKRRLKVSSIPHK